MNTQEILDHIKIHGKVCFTCDHCCCDNEDEDYIDARFWCDLPLMNNLSMNKTGALNMDCERWIIRNDNN